MVSGLFLPTLHKTPKLHYFCTEALSHALKSVWYRNDLCFIDISSVNSKYIGKSCANPNKYMTTQAPIEIYSIIHWYGFKVDSQKLNVPYVCSRLKKCIVRQTKTL